MIKHESRLNCPYREDRDNISYGSICDCGKDESHPVNYDFSKCSHPLRNTKHSMYCTLNVYGNQYVCPCGFIDEWNKGEKTPVPIKTPMENDPNNVLYWRYQCDDLEPEYITIVENHVVSSVRPHTSECIKGGIILETVDELKSLVKQLALDGRDCSYRNTCLSLNAENYRKAMKLLS